MGKDGPDLESSKFSSALRKSSDQILVTFLPDLVEFAKQKIPNLVTLPSHDLAVIESVARAHRSRIQIAG